MARLVTTLKIDTAGLRPMLRSFSSLHEALAIAQIDEEFELTSVKEGWAHEGHIIVTVDCSKMVAFVVYMRAAPTFWMPLFVAEVCRRAPGVKVKWKGGWPHYHAQDGDDETEEAPDPVAPILAPVS